MCLELKKLRASELTTYLYGMVLLLMGGEISA